MVDLTPGIPELLPEPVGLLGSQCSEGTLDDGKGLQGGGQQFLLQEVGGRCSESFETDRHVATFGGGEVVAAPLRLEPLPGMGTESRKVGNDRGDLLHVRPHESTDQGLHSL
ncbi:MAG: hypothetical protein ACK56F_05450, partial [bacterium]